VRFQTDVFLALLCLPRQFEGGVSVVFYMFCRLLIMSPSAMYKSTVHDYFRLMLFLVVVQVVVVEVPIQSPMGLCCRQ